MCLLGPVLKRRNTYAVPSAPGVCGKARFWGLFQAGKTFSFPGIRRLASTGGVHREAWETDVLSALEHAFEEAFLERSR